MSRTLNVVLALAVLSFGCLVAPTFADDPASSWLSYISYQAEGKVTMVNATWTVPPLPKESFGSNAPGWWFGIQTKDGNGALIQPILAYGYQGPVYTMFNGVFDWTDASWHTSWEKDTVDPGDTLVSSISLVGDREYEMKITSTKSGKTITTPYKLEDGQSEEETVVYFVLEHQPDTCAAYPANGECTFSNVYVEVEGKLVANPTWETHQEQPACDSKAQVVDARTLKITWDASSKTSAINTVAANATKKW